MAFVVVGTDSWAAGASSVGGTGGGVGLGGGIAQDLPEAGVGDHPIRRAEAEWTVKERWLWLRLWLWSTARE